MGTPKQDARPLRTVVFSAGSIRESIDAATTSGADAVVINVEEPETPYTPEVRERARITASDFLAKQQPGKGPLLFVRVQPPATGQMLGDLRAVMHPALAGIMLPKVVGSGDVIAADALLTNVETELGRKVGSTIIYPILETAQGLRMAYDIASASDRVGYLGGAVSRFGDICQALRFRWTPEGRESLFLRSKVLVDARAAGIRYPISGMWGGNTDDLSGLRNAVIALGIFFTPVFIRLIRGEVRTVRKSQLCETEISVGVPTPYIMWRHVLPLIAAPLIVQASLAVGTAILAETSLSFLGLGITPPNAS